MSALFTQLGVGVPALIAQALNFLIVLVVLTFFVYRPLGKLMDERSRRIAEGLRGAEEADKRLRQIADEAAKRAAQSEQEALVVMSEAKRQAEALGKQLTQTSEAKGEAIIKEAKTIANRESAEQMISVQARAREFVRAVISKTVELDPSKIDDKLIDQAIKLIRN